MLRAEGSIGRAATFQRVWTHLPAVASHSYCTTVFLVGGIALTCWGSRSLRTGFSLPACACFTFALLSWPELLAVIPETESPSHHDDLGR